MIRRPAARLLIVDATARLLMFRFEHKKGRQSGQFILATPGGALEPGESFKEAARSELREETGMEIADPGSAIANRRVVFALSSGEMVDAEERYFLIRVKRLAVSSAGWTEDEREIMTEHKGWSQAGLAASSEQIWPETIIAMLRDAGIWPDTGPPFGSMIVSRKEKPLRAAHRVLNRGRSLKRMLGQSKRTELLSHRITAS